MAREAILSVCGGGCSLRRAPQLLGEVRDGFASLRGSPTELWKAYVLKLLHSYSYYSFSLVLTLFLSAPPFSFTDVEAGTIYGLWGGLVTVYGMVAGVVVDNLGVAKSLKVGSCLSLVATTAIFATTSRAVVLLQVLLVLPFGNSMGIPVLTTGVRRYTNQSNQSFAYGFFYVVMCVGVMFSGLALDACTLFYGHDVGDGDGGHGAWYFSRYRAVIFSGVVANAVSCLVSITVREIKVHEVSPQSHATRDHDDEEQRLISSGARKHMYSREASRVSSFVPFRGGAFQILQETAREAKFRRLLVVCLCTVSVRMIFRHLDATLPKYMLREFGDRTPMGLIYAINPALVVVLVPVISAATRRIDPLVMILRGSYVSVASVFFLAASTSMSACIAFIATMSVGEAMWSPRLYDFTMSVATEGREGTYTALANAPVFFAKLPVGFLSGYLLQTYCPQEGVRSSRVMWMIIGMTSLISPVLLTLFWRYISNATEDGTSAAAVELSRSKIAKFRETNDGTAVAKESIV